MARIIGYCGIVCSECPVLAATRKNDEQERRRVASMFTQQYGREYKPDDINCGGCTTKDSRMFSYCSVCGIRKCGKNRNVKNCAWCPDYPYGNLSELLVITQKPRAY
jgi:hypothetical protein